MRKGLPKSLFPSTDYHARDRRPASSGEVKRAASDKVHEQGQQVEGTSDASGLRAGDRRRATGATYRDFRGVREELTWRERVNASRHGGRLSISAAGVQQVQDMQQESHTSRVSRLVLPPLPCHGGIHAHGVCTTES